MAQSTGVTAILPIWLRVRGSGVRLDHGLVAKCYATAIASVRSLNGNFTREKKRISELYRLKVYNTTPNCQKKIYYISKQTKRRRIALKRYV